METPLSSIEGLGPFAREILRKRGIVEPERIRAFLDPACYVPADPWELPGMEDSVRLLLEAVERGAKICVYGDYDTDGVTSTALLVSLLRSLKASVQYHVPDRFTEGYGMNETVIRGLAASGVEVILTCDCGIANAAEIKLAKELGLKVLVTDHHQMPEELPLADTIVNPQFLPSDHQAKHLPGVGVAYMLAQGLLAKTGGLANAEQFLDLVALGVVADVVPLLAENRFLLQRGLMLLNEFRRPGTRALCQVCRLEPGQISEEEVAFQMVPRLNAAGRMSTAALAVELLLAEERARAEELARQLDRINQQRKTLGEEILREAQGMLDLTFGPRPIVLYQPHWHHGIIGIIAGRLAELYKVPVLLMSLREDGVTVTGSARSIAGIHIYQVLQRCSEYLTKFGGHAGAAGFSLLLGQLDLFCKAVEKELEHAMQNVVFSKEEEYDLELGLEQATLETYRQVRCLGPFGEANPIPRFIARQVQVLSQHPIGDEKHLRLVMGDGKNSRQAIWWWGGGQRLADRVDVIFSLGLNNWQGQESIQLIINSVKEAAPRLEIREKTCALEIVDLRNWLEFGKELPQWHNAAYFLEGRFRQFNLPVHNRASLPCADILVLLSAPPSIRVLQELLALSRPVRLVLAYGQGELGIDKEFVHTLAGMVKYAQTNKGGIVDICAAAAASGQTETTVLAGLRFLQAKGWIDLEFVGPQQVSVQQGDQQAKPVLSQAEARLRALTEETRAFRRYLLKVSPENLARLLQDFPGIYLAAGST